MNLTLEILNSIYENCRKHFDECYNDVEAGDVIYSYLHFEKNGFNWDKFHILNDWSEGESNDPFWDKETNMHSAEKFILDECKRLKELLITN
jgi:hypothetical protein